jgi:hypothetical protein
MYGHQMVARRVRVGVYSSSFANSNTPHNYVAKLSKIWLV